MQFRTIDVQTDKETIVRFRKDSYAVSFGSIDGFGDEDAYVTRIAERAARFPDGLVLVEEDGRTIGQMELQILPYAGKDIGYVNLYYLVPAYRGKGYGRQLMQYAEQFFRNNGMTEYHLRVSLTNQRAIDFYIKCGMHKLNQEQEKYVVWRMGKYLY